ncbi:hypothetical protein D3C80_1021990 [compost metagenome]
MKFSKCKRRFDVTVKVAEDVSGDRVIFEGSVCVWAYGPSLRLLSQPVLDEIKHRGNASISVLYVREHDFEEYSPAQLGKMMAQEGERDVNENPFVGDDRAELWQDAFQKEVQFLESRR